MDLPETSFVSLQNDNPEDRALNYVPAPMPANESERLAVLRSCQILETEDEQFFDDVTFLAKTICRTPIAVISLIDEKRQWFKSRIGLEARETPRAVSFCAHGILQPDRIFEVHDALTDERFAGNPVVLGDPNIRFYAGAPIVVHGGTPLGMVCVIDRKPGKLNDEQAAALTSLARRVAVELEQRAAAAAANQKS
jgi:GAF domain-containing protein